LARPRNAARKADRPPGRPRRRSVCDRRDVAKGAQKLTEALGYKTAGVFFQPPADEGAWLRRVAACRSGGDELVTGDSNVAVIIEQCVQRRGAAAVFLLPGLHRGLWASLRMVIRRGFPARRHPDSATARSITDVALQQRLGLLPQRRHRPHPADRRDFAPDGTALSSDTPSSQLHLVLWTGGVTSGAAAPPRP
jgi:hypothetical protein